MPASLRERAPRSRTPTFSPRPGVRVHRGGIRPLHSRRTVPRGARESRDGAGIAARARSRRTQPAPSADLTMWAQVWDPENVAMTNIQTTMKVAPQPNTG